ncbi:hypothetical protein ACU2LT_004653, partial [Salmonella enterica subsp. enterica serovar Braenderup]
DITPQRVLEELHSLLSEEGV